MRNIKFAKPDITAVDYSRVKALLRDNDQLTDGVKCRTFEKKFSDYIGGANCLAVSSCMAALHLSYLVLGIGPGDEVICPAMSHVATAHAIELVGARPIFVDCRNGGNIDVHLVKKNITSRTKAITVVHYAGKSADMDKIIPLAEDYDLRVIEDCALAIGTKSSYDNNHVGTQGDCAAFSFYPTKHITTGEGGMFVTRSSVKYEKAKRIARFGKIGGASDYDVVYLGLNYRMSEMQACLGISQLERIKDYIQKRRDNYIHYVSRLGSYGAGGISMFIGDSYYCFVKYFRSVEERNRMKLILKDKGVETSIYYPHPIPRLDYYRKKYGWRKLLYRNAISIADRSLALPTGPHITTEDIDYIADVIKEVQ